MYNFLIGPGLWITFIVFLGGLVVRIAYLFGLSRVKDKALFNHADLEWGLKSIAHWTIPFASVSMRRHPVFTIMAFAFHISLFAVPLLFLAHNILWDEAFGMSIWSISDHLADSFTLILIISGLFLLLRRLVLKEVRILTSGWDYLLLILTMLPFVTGFLAFHQIGPYDTLLTLHIFFGEILLILIPFTKLSHGFLFFFTRAFIGFDMGRRRGVRSW